MGKYLTQEAFGNRINCAAGVMKKKQIFFLENGDGTGESADGGAVHIRSHTGTSHFHILKKHTFSPTIFIFLAASQTC